MTVVSSWGLCSQRVANVISTDELRNWALRLKNKTFETSSTMSTSTATYTGSDYAAWPANHSTLLFADV